MEGIKIGVFYIFFLVLLLSGYATSAQSSGNHLIQVGRTKTTYLIIAGTTPVSADIGGEPGAILFEQQEKSTILKLKANKDNFTSTNMLIVCKDTIFECDLVYASNPIKTRDSLVYYGKGGGSGVSDDANGKSRTTNAVISDDPFTKIRNIKKNISLSQMSNKMIFFLDNIAVTADSIYFKVRLKNNTTIDYKIDYLNFQVESLKHSLKPSSEQTLFPAYSEDVNNKRIIQAKKDEILTYGLKKFALREDEVLYITVFEESLNSKGRQVKLRVRATFFENVKVL